MVKKAIGTIVGLVIVLAWWTIKGPGSGTAEASSIPTKVWSGGAGTLTIELETTAAGRVHIDFNDRTDKEKRLNATEMIAAGSHKWTIDIPANAGGYVEFSSDTAKKGDRIVWKLYLNGRVIDEQTETLEEDLKPNHAFGVQAHYDDYSKASRDEDD